MPRDLILAHKALWGWPALESQRTCSTIMASNCHGCKSLQVPTKQARGRTPGIHRFTCLFRKAQDRYARKKTCANDLSLNLNAHKQQSEKDIPIRFYAMLHWSCQRLFSLNG